MCRKNHLHGCAIAAFGFGLIVGHSVESWWLCCCGGMALLLAGICVMRKK